MLNENDLHAELRRLRLRVDELERENTALRATDAPPSGIAGLLSMCASCKRIHEDDGGWITLEVYLTGRTPAEISHSLCPTCAPAYGFSTP